MHILTKVFLFNFLILTATNACAASDLSFMKQGTSYSDARKILVDKGWKPIKNMNINNSSLYAQEIYLQGLEEVVDCISMEIDACTFRFTQKNRVLDVKTITRQLNLESFKNYKQH